MIRVIGDGGINWNWYLAADFNETEKTCHVYYYRRWHKYENRGSNHPANADWKVRMTMLETSDGKRILYGIRLDEIEYLVTNPAYVFNYQDMSVYVSE